MDPYWGSLHCVGTLIVPLLTQMYKWVLVGERGVAGCSRGSLNFVFVYKQEFSFHALFGRVKAKKITVKLLKIKGHTFRNTTYSKATRLCLTMQYQ